MTAAERELQELEQQMDAAWMRWQRLENDDTLHTTGSPYWAEKRAAQDTYFALKRQYQAQAQGCR
jgi:hypothetical protein